MPANAKRYIAQNNINVYLIDAIDLAAKVGMGKRTNTVLQSAFFALAGVLPQEDAIRYMKEAATKSYAKKGEAIVEANHKAIDAGATAFVKFDVPADWADATDAAPASVLSDEEKSAIAKQVKELMEPIARMDGDSLPVSAFKDYADGQFELGASQFEKRGVAVMVPHWDETKCIQCNQCAYVCPHATIRPFALNEAEVAEAPETMRMLDVKIPKDTGYKFAIAVSPLDCMGCTNCAKVCPKDALTMVPAEGELVEQKTFDYCVANVAEKPELIGNNVKSSQFKQPLLEFSRLLRRLRRDGLRSPGDPGLRRPHVHLQRHRLLLHLGQPGRDLPVLHRQERPWPGMEQLPVRGQRRARPRSRARLQGSPGQARRPDRGAHGFRLRDRRAEGRRSGLDRLPRRCRGLQAAAAAYIEQLEACGCDKAKAILADKAYLTKKSFWIFGGDGWAYDIGFGGLDHVLASGNNVNVFVFDTEVYSNTGGQASKASNLGQVAQFAAAGKNIKKKSLAEIAMSYGYVYVAQVAMGANPAQTLKAIHEAEAYDGPSIIIGYSPCEMHSIKKGGMQNCQAEMKKAVDCGYWNLFRYNSAAPEGKKFALDSKERPAVTRSSS